MRSFHKRRSVVLIASSLAVPALIAPVASHAGRTATSALLKPTVSTGAAQHVLASSALLTGTLNPNGIPTSYYFQWGPSTAYGAQTPTVSVGAGTTRVKVGQAIVGLQRGALYHFRIVALYGQGAVAFGKDRSFIVAGSGLKFELAKAPRVVVGTPFILSGTLTGLGAANLTVILQASPFPYLQPFTTIGLPGTTDRFGRFAFRVAHLSRSTEFRVITADLRPLYSRVLTVPAMVRVTLRVRSSGRPGLVRLFGTVTPAAVGARVSLQLLKAVRPGPGRGSEESEESETATRYVTQFRTVVKKATRSFSRFSMVVNVRHGGRYRAFVKVKPGPVASGYSSQTVVLHAAPSRKARRR
jgi:hypothetical protein